MLVGACSKYAILGGRPVVFNEAHRLSATFAGRQTIKTTHRNVKCSPPKSSTPHAVHNTCPDQAMHTSWLGVQVDCNWAGSITIRVLEYLTVNASYLKLILFNVAGPATIKAVAVKTRGTPVSYWNVLLSMASTPDGVGNTQLRAVSCFGHFNSPGLQKCNVAFVHVYTETADSAVCTRQDTSLGAAAECFWSYAEAHGAADCCYSADPCQCQPRQALSGVPGARRRTMHTCR